MRASLTAKQTAGVTALIALSMSVLSAQHVANLARTGLENSRRSGELLGRVIYQRARDAIGGAPTPHDAIQSDLGIRSILESTAAYGPNVTYAAIVDNSGVAIAHSDRSLEGHRMEPRPNLGVVVESNTVERIRAIYADQTLEIVLPLQLGEAPFGAIRIGLSPVLIRDDLARAISPIVWTTIAITAASILIGLILARRILRPIHVISSGLLRLQRGETDFTLELPAEEELKGVGESFKVIGERLALRSQAEVLDPADYSRKLSALGRLMAGLAHEVKNPLNAMTIHLELVRQHLLKATEAEGANEHLEVISGEIKRLDDVIQGFLRFIRPQDLQLRPADANLLVEDVLALVKPDAVRSGITCRTEFSGAVPVLSADEALLRQALLNLALNACQAMPNGGILTLGARAASDGRAVLVVEDTGVGIPANQLEKIFELYFTTRPGGSGIGLSMVYRIIQLHGGEIEVESTVGRGTTFRIRLPHA
jgi:signal transduction histidine kinase